MALPGTLSTQYVRAIYQRVNISKANLAMKIGGEYRLSNISLRHWLRLAADVHTDPEPLVARTRVMAAGLPDLIATIQKEVETDGLSHRTISVLAQRLKSRAKLA